MNKLFKVKTKITLFIDLDDNLVDTINPKYWSAQKYYKYGVDYITIRQGSKLEAYNYNEWLGIKEERSKDKIILVNKKNESIIFDNLFDLVNSNYFTIIK